MKKVQRKNYNLIFRTVFGVLSLAVMVVIFFFSSQQGSDSDNTSITFISLLLGKNTNLAIAFNAFLRETAHMVEFAALAVSVFLFVNTFKINSFFRVVFTVVFSSAYALSDEIHQVFVPGRSGQLYDILIDDLGILLSVFVLHFLMNLGNKIEIRNLFGKLSSEDTVIIDAFSSHITGKPVSFDFNNEEFELCKKKAYEHKLTPVFVSELNKYKVPADKINNFEAYKIDALMRVASQIKKNNTFLKIYKLLQSSGIDAICVKGPLCARYYPNPDMRMSGDFDLLVKEADYEKCVKLLTENNFKGKNTGKYDNTFVDYVSDCHIELHRAFFPHDKSFYSQFNNLLEPLWDGVTKVKCGDCDILTLNADKHMLYLILHAFKHFVVAGVGIRQICDISLFAENNDLDWKFIFGQLKKVNLQGFANSILLIGEKYFGVDISKISAKVPDFNKKLDILPMLCDIMSGGVYGGENPERHNSGNITFSAYNKNIGDESSKVNILFPPKEVMKRKYPNMKDTKWGLVSAWLSRILRYFVLGGDSSAMLDLAAKRKSLLRDYGMLEKNKNINRTEN